MEVGVGETKTTHLGLLGDILSSTLTVSAHLVKMEAGKARLYKDCIGWPKTQLLGAPTPAASPRWRCCQWPQQGAEAHCRDPLRLSDRIPGA